MPKTWCYEVMIYCIGDSHATFFSGSAGLKGSNGKPIRDRIPEFKTYSIGAVLAYKLCEENSNSRGREKLFELLEAMPKDSNIMLVFGEIDCRAHIVKQAKLSRSSISKVVKQCVDRYFSTVIEFKKAGFNSLILWGVNPSIGHTDKLSKEYPAYGSYSQRLEAVKEFNRYLSQRAAKQQITFISIADQIRDPKYYFDGIHLAPRALPLAIKELERHGINLPKLFTCSSLNYLPPPLRMIMFGWKCELISMRLKIRRSYPWFFIGPFAFLNIFLGKFGYQLLFRKLKPLIPSPEEKRRIIVDLAMKNGLDTLIETGTYLGDTIDAFKGNFKKIYSIELGRHLYEKAKQRFIKERHIELIRGDSGEKLPLLLAKIRRPAIFWLDGHFSGDVCAKSYLNTPIVKELQAIFSHPVKKHVILIDDARDFTGRNDYPTVDHIKEFVSEHSGYRVEIKSDVIIITPDA